MSGAYVAKPDAVIPVIVPPDWNPDWPFPGAYPPGYAPDYSLDITSADALAVGGSLAASILLHDHDTYKTNQPTAAARITWAATIDGDPVQLKFSGDEEYANSIQSSYSDQGSSFWGAAPTIEFDTAEEDIGKILILSANSSALNSTITGSKEITISNKVTVTISLSWTVGEPEVEPDPDDIDTWWIWGIVSHIMPAFSEFAPVCNLVVTDGYNSEPSVVKITTAGRNNISCYYPVVNGAIIEYTDFGNTDIPFPFADISVGSLDKYLIDISISMVVLIRMGGEILSTYSSTLTNGNPGQLFNITLNYKTGEVL